MAKRKQSKRAQRELLVYVEPSQGYHSIVPDKNMSNYAGRKLYKYRLVGSGKVKVKTTLV